MTIIMSQQYYIQNVPNLYLIIVLFLIVNLNLSTCTSTQSKYLLLFCFLLFIPFLLNLTFLSYSHLLYCYLILYIHILKQLMKMEYQGYNQTINQLYFNPYSHNFNKLNSPAASHPNLPSATQQYGLLSPDKNGNGIKSMQELQPRQNRQRGMRLSASQIFTSIQKQPQTAQTQTPQKPTINYFVTQFQRLQSQNKHLLQQIQQLKKGEGITKTEQNTHISLMEQNKYLRQQLEEQQKLNIQKNQQIQRLVHQIQQIQREVGCVIRDRAVEEREEEDRRRRDMEREKERQEMFAYQIQQLKQQIQQKHEKQKQALLHQHQQNLSILLSQHQQQQQQALQQKQVQRQKAAKQQELITQYQSKLQWYIQKIKEQQKQKEERQKQQNQKIEGVKLYYNDLISQQTCMLMERIRVLEVQVDAIKQQYCLLEEEVNNIRYVPVFK